MGKKKTLSGTAEANELETDSSDLTSKLNETRSKIFENEKRLRALIKKKSSTEDKLNTLLKKTYSNEKGKLERIKRKSAQEEADLKRRVDSLEKITRIYDEKRSRILEAKKRRAELRRQLARLDEATVGWD
ncbi:MAG: hypothetical protein JW772_05500 [Candidatus Diapherotrites archaeon]|nr:hypothetical protein [Candidatus Diapherotrites archaeon]